MALAQEGFQLPLPINPITPVNPTKPNPPPVTNPGSPSTDQSKLIPIDDVQLRKGTLARLYWARVLMEDYKKWNQSAELIRFVLTNDKKIPTPVIRKLRKVYDALISHSPKAMMRKALDFRHLTRPFLLSQYLLNECIMDLRVNLNYSNNSELKFIEKALLSYFFPGTESVGKIVYPADATYKFDLYALSEANVAAARLDSADSPLNDETKSRTRPLPPPGSGGTPGLPIIPIVPPDRGGTIIPAGVINQGALDRVSLINRQALDFNGAVRMVAPEGFLQQLIDLGLNVDELSQYAKRLIDELKPSTRVPNRYLPQALLVQALSDPGSIVLDPQLQDFVRGVQLKLEVAQLDKEERKGFIDLFNSLDGNLVNKTKKDDTWSIDLTKLMQEQYQNGASKTEILMEHSHNSAVGATLYVVTGIGGADQMRMRVFQALFKAGKDSAFIKSFLGKTVGTSWEALVSDVPRKLRQLYVQQRRLWSSRSYFARMQGTLILIPQVFYRGVQVADQALTLGKTEPVQKFITHLNQLRAVQWARKIGDPAYRWSKMNTTNGNFFKILTAAAVVTEVSTGVIDYNSTDSDREKIEIALRSSSNALSHMTYVVPRIGWPAVALDVANMVGWTELSTAKIYSNLELYLYQQFAGDLTIRFLEEYESELMLPEPKSHFDQISEMLEDSSRDPEEIKAAITTNLQDLAQRYILIDYLGHKDAARFSRHSFGEKIEEYLFELEDSRSFYSQMLVTLDEKVEDGFFKGGDSEEEEEPVPPLEPVDGQ